MDTTSVPVWQALLDARAAHDRTAFRHAGTGAALGWAALAATGSAWRVALSAVATPARPRVALAVADPLGFTAAYLGALAAGATVMPLDPRATPTELAGAARRLGADLLAGDARACDTTAGLLDAARWLVPAAGVAPVVVAPARSRPRPPALRPAVLLASSGTSGVPKGVPLSSWQLLAGARRIARHHRLGPGERGYTPLPLFHVNAQVVGLLSTVVSGAELVVDAGFDRDAYWDRVATWRPTWLNLVPAAIAALVAAGGGPSHPVRFARTASAPLPAPLRPAFHDRFAIPLVETYGMTEAASQITANPLTGGRPGSVGVPVGVGLTVTRPDGAPTGPGEVGQVRLRGRMVVARYLTLGEDAEGIRPARDPDGWLPTGDLGSRDADGYLTLVGRSDDVINRGGEKVYPAEIEDVLAAHPAVRTAAVAAAPHPRLGQVPVGYAVLRPGAGPTRPSELEGWCADRLTPWKRPVRVEIVETLPTGPTGKVLRRALRSALAAPSDCQPPTAPADPAHQEDAS